MFEVGARSAHDFEDILRGAAMLAISSRAQKSQTCKECGCELIVKLYVPYF